MDSGAALVFFFFLIIAFVDRLLSCVYDGKSANPSVTAFCDSPVPGSRCVCSISIQTYIGDFSAERNGRRCGYILRRCEVNIRTAATHIPAPLLASARPDKPATRTTRRGSHLRVHQRCRSARVPWNILVAFLCMLASPLLYLSFFPVNETRPVISIVCGCGMIRLLLCLNIESSLTIA